MDFSQGKIYKIYSDKTDKIYIGSTCKTLKSRLQTHKNNFTNFNKGLYKANVSVFELFRMYDDVKIDLIENYVCNNKEELRRKEREITESYNKNIVLNKNKSIQSNEERIKQCEDYYYRTKNIKSNKIHCQCGGSYNYYSKYIHFKSKKHLLFQCK
jgi:hypothetical protein